jgi:hypothetical protein
MSRSVVTRLIALIAAAASAVAAVVLVRRRRGQYPSQFEAAEKPADVLAEHYNIFEGLYEPLYQALRSDRDDQLREVLNEWDIRARHVDDDRLKRAWQALAGTESVPLSEVVADQPMRELGTRLAAAVADAGIIRDDRASFLIDDDNERRYRFDRAPETGSMAEVEIPCWTVGPQVAERGIAHLRETPTTQSPG